MSVDRSPLEEQLLEDLFEKWGEHFVMPDPLEHKRYREPRWADIKPPPDPFDPSVFGGRTPPARRSFNLVKGRTEEIR